MVSRAVPFAALVVVRATAVTGCIAESSPHSSVLLSELEAGTRSGQLPVLSVSVDVSVGIVVLSVLAADMLGFRERLAIPAVASWMVGGG